MASKGFEFGLDLFCRQQGITKAALAQAADCKEVELGSWLEKVAIGPAPHSSQRPFSNLESSVAGTSKSKISPELLEKVKKLGLVGAIGGLGGAGAGGLLGEEGGGVRGAITGAGAGIGARLGAQAAGGPAGLSMLNARLTNPATEMAPKLFNTAAGKTIAGGLGGAAAGGTLAYILSRYLKPVPEKTV